MKPPYAIGSVPSLSGHAIPYRWRSLPRVRRHGASKPQGSSERVLPWQVTMDQLIFASLSRTYYWYEVGMLKVSAVNIIWNFFYCVLKMFCFVFVWWSCMAINVSVQHYGGLLPGIILVAQCYYHRGTCLNAMKRFCLSTLRSHLNVLTFPPLTGGSSEGLDAFRLFLGKRSKLFFQIKKKSAPKSLKRSF